MPYWIAGDLLIRGRSNTLTEVEAYDWVTRRWKPIPELTIRQVGRRGWRPLTKAEVDALVSNP